MRKFAAKTLSAVLVMGLIPSMAWANQETFTYYEGTGDLQIRQLAAYSTGAGWDEGGAEIVAYDSHNQKAYVLNGADTAVEVVDFSKLSSNAKRNGVNKLAATKKIKLTDFGLTQIKDITSIAVGPKGEWVALTVVADPSQHKGKVVFLDSNGQYIGNVEVGALPDMIGLTPDGKTLFVANEGEPSGDYSVDPEGSVALIDVSNGVRGLTQSAVTLVRFDNETIVDKQVRIGKPGATYAEDFEPEYIAASADSTTLYVALQENNAVATLDVAGKKFVSVKGLGYKDHSVAGYGLDASDKDGAIRIKRWPVKGLYMPDGIDTTTINGKTYLLTANEGDAREYGDFADEVRAGKLEGKLALDARHYKGYTQAQLDEWTAGNWHGDEEMGRLKLLADMGLKEDGQYEALYSYGARSFTIWDPATMKPVFDSGDQFERITAAAHPEQFNVSNSDAEFDGRSDDKGPEPEDVKTGVIGGQTYAFVGLERAGGIMAYNITNPAKSKLAAYFSTRDFGVENGGDSGPEGLKFIPAEQSPTGNAMLLVGFETSGTLGVYELTEAEVSTKISLLHTNDSHGRAMEASNDGMGFAKIATLVEQFRVDRENTLLLDAGDTLHGTTFATLMQGESIVEVMNETGYDAMAPGNHDFNYGYKRLLDLEDLMEFPLVSANVKDANGNRLFEPYIIKEMDGIRLGIFGLTTPETTYKTHPNNIQGLVFTDPAEEARKVIAELEGKVDAIIAVTHLGIDESSTDTSIKVAKEAPGIDVIIDGHSHSTLVEGLAAGESTLIASSGEYTKNLGVVELVFNGDRELTGKEAYLINKDQTAAVEPHPDVVAIIEHIQDKQAEVLTQVVGKSGVQLNGEREFVRTSETNLGNLITDAMLHVTKADVSLTNGGGIRASINAGDITKGDVITVLPFGNYIVTKKVTGAMLKAALENGASAYPESKGAFAHVGGMTYAIDPAKAAGERVHSIKVNGKPLDPAARYMLATNDFMAAGGDEYTMFGDVPIAGEYPALDEALITYIQHLGNVNAAVEGRIVEAPAAGTTNGGGEKPATQPTEPTAKVSYTVRRGDTLWAIGRKHGVSWQELAEINKLANPNLIHPGQVLLIP